MAWSMDLSDVGHLAESVHNGDAFDIFGIAALIAPGDDVHTENIAAIAEHLTGFLVGADRSRDDRIADVLRRHPRNRLDRLTAEIAVHLGLDPAVAVALADPIGGASFATTPGGDGLYLNSPDGIEPETTIHITPTLRWCMIGHVSVDGLALQVVQALPGCSLRDVVSHPVLDRHPLVISQTTTSPNGRTAHLILEGVPPVLEPDQLLDLRPCVPQAA